MSVYGAHEAKIYYVEESTYGETPTTPDMLGIGPVENVEPAINPGLIKVRGTGSVDLQAIKKGLRQPSVKVAFALPSDSPIGFIQWAKVELNKSLSIEVLYEKGSSIISLLYKGCKFHRLNLACSVEDIIKGDAELLGQDLVVGTAGIGSTYGDHPYAIPFYDSYVKKATTTLERVTDWKCTIENNLKRVPVIKTNGHILKYLPHRHRNLTGELTFEFESKEEFDDVINDTEFNLEFGLSGTNKIVFSNCKWENVATPTRIEDLVALKAPFVAKGPVAIS